MTLLFRFVSLALITSFMAGCETLYVDQPMQPQPSPVYPAPQPKVIHKTEPPPVYQSQPDTHQVPVAPPAPPTPPMPARVAPAAVAPAPSKVIAPAVEERNVPVVAPVREPGSISELPDPS